MDQGKRIVLFDAYGTLFEIDSDNARLESILKTDKQEFLSVWRSKLLEYSWLTSLAGQWEEFDTIISKALHYACLRFSIKLEQVEPLLMSIYSQPSLFDDAGVLLENQTFTACIISNGGKETLSRAVRKNNLNGRIHKIFTASEVRKYKVAKEVYELPRKHFGKEFSSFLFVSSNPWDISGAAIFGYETIWVNRNDTVFDCLVEGAPSHEIDDLRKVVNLL